MSPEFLEPRDLQQLAGRGIAVHEVERQLALFRRPPVFVRLDRAATLGDGIERLDATAALDCLRAYEEAKVAGRFSKFVPASGAASRMFATLLEIQHRKPVPGVTTLRAEARTSAAARDALQFYAEIDRLPIRDELTRALAAAGLDLAQVRAQEDIACLLHYLLAPAGLDCGARPKALLPFHRYPEGTRTAFEEHLVEAAHIAGDSKRCPLHFTVSPQHLEYFLELFDRVQETHARRLGVCFEVDFSVQSSSTDTLAVDLENQPFRSADGELLFRPAGHGALIENLDALQGDFVFVKNIDNVAIEARNHDSILWQKYLAGYLCRVQARVFEVLRRLETAPVTEIARQCLPFVRDELHIPIADELEAGDAGALRHYLQTKLDRPIRVCGMVPNTGEPGGGPFWVRDAAGAATLQIIERTQLDPGSTQQQQVFATGTHFNPVDLVCALRDARGRCYPLERFLDAGAVLIAEKTSAGRRLKALERPGLWNGAMSDWTTLFVEIPGSTFNPVKSFVDLLRPAHQPE